jgi:uncharacterized membrane protein
MRSPFSLIYLLIFIVLLSILLLIAQLGIISFAFDKLGLDSSSAALLLFGSLFGSAINLPLFTIRAEQPSDTPPPVPQGLLSGFNRPFTGRTLVAINVGGCLIPVFFSLYLIRYNAIDWFDIITTILLVTVVANRFSRPIAGLGIGMPILIAPLTAAIVALVINPQYSAPLAYIGGTMGVLLGADLLRLQNIRRMGAPVASIGGAGTFDGIFLTGIVAVLLA